MKVNFLVLICSFILASIIIYFFKPDKKSHYEFPTPYNLDTIYNGEHSNCFVFKKKQVKCDKNSLEHLIPTKNGI